MLLRFHRHLTAIRDDRGNVMIAVIGLLAVTTIITVTISTATVRALGYTSFTRASVQSTAAADAGVDAMLAAVTQNACPPTAELTATYGDIDPSVTGAAGDQPFYTATIAQRPDDSTAWAFGCPSNATAQIRIQSTGFALAQGVAESASAGDDAAVEAIYEWLPGELTSAASGAAVYSYGTPGLSNSLELLQFEGSQANVMVREGSIVCSNSVTVEGDIIAANGNITLDNTCSADGNVWASGTVTLNNNQDVGGDVIAVGSGTTTISPNSTIGGGVYAGGPLNSWGPRCSSGATGWNAAGNACAIARSSGADPVLYNQADLPSPEVPEWVDVDYIPQDWIDAGWNIVTYAGACTIDNRTKNDAPVRAFSTYTTPTVIDARACSSFVMSSSASVELNLRTDLTFILPKNANLENFTVSPYLNQPRALRFITPDTVADQRPTTAGCGRIDINNRNVIRDPVSVLVYTPCNANNSNNMTWRGQFYAGRVNFSNNSSLTYVPVGVPGYDLNGGEPPVSGGGTSTTGSLGRLLEYRDIAVPA